MLNACQRSLVLSARIWSGINLISKDSSRAELEDMNIDPPPQKKYIIKIKHLALQTHCRSQTVGPLSSATCPLIFMQLTGQSNGGTASSAFLLTRKCN